MPPKGSRGGRGGRGRGRGASTAGLRGGGDASTDATPAQDVAVEPPPAAAVPSNEEPQAPADTIASASASPAPARPTPKPATTSTRTASRSASVATSAKGGFKPNFVRRSEAERKALAEQEAKRQAGIKAEEDKKLKAQQRLQRGRGGLRARGGRGRGGIRSMPSGPFSAPPPMTGRSMNTGGGGASGSGSGGGSGAEAPARDPTIFDPALGSNQFASNGANGDGFGRINADHFTRHIQQDGDAVNLSARSRQLLPMGIGREEHKESKIVIATLAELEAREKQISLEDLAIDNGVDTEAWAGSGQRATVKTDDDREVVAIDELADLEQQGSPAKLKTPVNSQTQKPMAMPADDNDEWNQDEYDKGERRKVLETFVDPPDVEHTEDPRYGGVFIFQFPPVMPPLHLETQEKPVTVIKDEPTDVDINNLGKIPISGKSNAAAVDLTNDTVVKEEEEEIREIEGPIDPRDKFSTHGAGLGDIGEGGYLGDLVVRKSGKAELTWGGGSVKFSMVPGLEVSCLRHAMLLIMDEKKKREGGDGDGQEGAASEAYSGTAYELGPVMGKFNFAPILSPEEPWVVAPSQLGSKDKGKEKA